MEGDTVECLNLGGKNRSLALKVERATVGNRGRSSLGGNIILRMKHTQKVWVRVVK